jgi:hypothetical protein
MANRRRKDDARIGRGCATVASSFVNLLIVLVLGYIIIQYIGNIQHFPEDVQKAITPVKLRGEIANATLGIIALVFIVFTKMRRLIVRVVVRTVIPLCGTTTTRDLPASASEHEMIVLTFLYLLLSITTVFFLVNR